MKVKEFIEKLQKMNQESDVWIFDDFPNKNGWTPAIDVISKIEANYIARKTKRNEPTPKEGDISLT